MCPPKHGYISPIDRAFKKAIEGYVRDNLNEENMRIKFSEVEGKNMSLTMHPIIKLIKDAIVISGI
jgi:hypothetical protein